jgi:UDP-GlcNAc:undecaprenyl-phosphate GlcNAc-1-phosphate transferase
VFVYHLIKYPVLVFFAFGISYLLTPRVRDLALRFRLVDLPSDRRLHSIPIPRLGGIAVFAAFHAACVLGYLLTEGTTIASSIDIEWWRAFTFGSLALLVLGIVDDIKGLSWSAKLLGQVAIGVGVFAFGVQMNRIQGIDLPLALNMAATVVWFLVFINAFNLIDGMDGLAGGLACLAAMGMAGAAFLRGAPGDALVFLALMGACLGFLRYNFHPASIFLGDSGSMFLGFTLAALALTTSTKGSVVTTLAVPLLAAGVPIFDTLLAVWRRSMRAFLNSGEGKGLLEVMGADMDHLHHRLLGAGLKQRRVAVSLYLANAALISVGILALLFQNRSTGIFLIAFLAGSYVVVRHIAHVELWDSGNAIMRGLKRPERRVLAAVVYPFADVCTLAVSLVCGLALTAEYSQVGELKGLFLGEVSEWIALPFLALVFGGAYRQVWSMARVVEFAFLEVALVFGIALSTGFELLWDGAALVSQARFSLIFFGVAAAGITGVRALPRVAQELMNSFSHWVVKDAKNVERVVVYGSSMAILLYLRETNASYRERGIVRVLTGILSSQRGLHGRRMFGAEVVGGLERLHELAREERIDRLVMVESCSPDERDFVDIVADAHGFVVSEWRFSELASDEVKKPAAMIA